MTNIASGAGQWISRAHYDAAGRPSPRSVTRIAGDRLTRVWGQADITYSVMGFSTVLTRAQWDRMGNPAPSVIQPPVFVYGTLRPGQAPYNRLLAGRTTAEPLTSMASLSMHLSANRAYPWAVTGGNGITGNQMTIRSGVYAQTMGEIDAYERYNPSVPAAQQPYYVRELRATRTGTRSWVYLASPRMAPYVRQSLPLIPSGDWFRR